METERPNLIRPEENPAFNGLVYEPVTFRKFAHQPDYETLLTRLAETSVPEPTLAKQLLKVEALPTTYFFAQFSKLAYEKHIFLETRFTLPAKAKKLCFPEGWMALTSAQSNKFGPMYYFYSMVFYSRQARQIIIAIRGTKFSLGSFKTDQEMILSNRYTPQLSSTCTLVHTIANAVQKMEERERQLGKKLPRWEIMLTGHSIGGWLAQVATLSLKYLELDNKQFTKRSDAFETFHPHTEVFESPGCMEMFRKIARDHGFAINLKDFDITTYLSAPNLINCCNNHIGKMFRLYPDFSDWGFHITSNYTMNSHKMEAILNCFDFKTELPFEDDNGNVKMKKVIKWPSRPDILTTSEDIEEYSKTVKEYRPENDCVNFSKDGLIYYQTKAELSRFKYSYVIFTQRERKILYRLYCLRKINRVLIQDNDIDYKISLIEVEKRAVYFNIRTNELLIDDYNDIRRLILYARALIQLDPELEIKAKYEYRTNIGNMLGDKFYQDLSKDYEDKIMSNCVMLSPRITFDEFDSFLKNDLSLLHIDVDYGYTFLVTALVLKKLIGYWGFDYRITMKVKDFFSTRKMLYLKDVIEPYRRPLIILDYKMVSDVKEIEDLLNIISGIVGDKSSCKVVLISQKTIHEEIKNISEAVFGDKCLSINHGGINWIDLSEAAQKLLLEKKVISIQSGPRHPLERFATKEDQLEMMIKPRVIAQFLKGEHVTIGTPLDTLPENYTARRFELIPVPYVEVLSSFETNQDVDVTVPEIVITKCSTFYTQRQVLEDMLPKQRRLVITGYSDIGTSTVLNAIGKGIKAAAPLSWIILIQFRDCIDVLKDWLTKPEDALKDNKNNKYLSPSKVVAFLSDHLLPRNPNTILKNSLERRMLEYGILSDGGVSLLWDGFNDVPSECHNFILKILKTLRQTKVDNMVVTSRPHIAARLSVVLDAPHLKLVPFTVDDALDCLTSYWKDHFGMEREYTEFQPFADEYIRNSVDQHIYGVPFHCQLLADYMVENKNKIKDLKVFEHRKITLLELYENYIDSLLPIADYFDEGNCIVRIRNVIVQNQIYQYALELLVPDQISCLFPYKIEDSELKLMVHCEMLRTGLLQPSRTSPTFVHSAVAQYFVYHYFTAISKDECNKYDGQLKMLCLEILLNPELRIIRKHFDDSYYLKLTDGRFSSTGTLWKMYCFLVRYNWEGHKRLVLTDKMESAVHVMLKEGLPMYTYFIDHLIGYVPDKETIKSFMHFADNDGWTILKLESENPSENYITFLRDNKF